MSFDKGLGIEVLYEPKVVKGMQCGQDYCRILQNMFRGVGGMTEDVILFKQILKISERMQAIVVRPSQIRYTVLHRNLSYYRYDSPQYSAILDFTS